MTPKRNTKRARPRKGDKSHQQQRQARVGWPNEQIFIALTGAVFLVHSLGLALLFVPMQGLLDKQPIIEQDWGLHFHHLKSMEAFWHQDRAIWGYNPFFMAGYPSNTIQDLSVKLFEFLALGLSTLALSPIQWFKLWAFVAMGLVPWFMYFAARNFFHEHELKNRAALSAALLGTAYWWNSLPREMFFYGMIGYLSAAYLTVLGASLLYRMGTQAAPGGPVGIGFFLFALAILPLHIQSILIILPPAVALLIARPDLLQRRFILWVIGAAVSSLLVNLIWLGPAWSHRGNDIAAAIVDELPLFTSRDPWTFLKDYLGPQSYWSFRPSFWDKGLRLMLLILGSWGTLALLRSKHKALGVTLVGALFALFVISYFGSFIPFLKAWQSLRFKVPYDLFLILPASYLIAVRFRYRSSPSYAVTTLLLSGAAAFVINLEQTESQGRLKLRARILPEVSAIVEWIRTETPLQARVLFEESGDETSFVYDGMYLSSFVPHWTGRQLIGGPINLYNDRHHFAEFHSGKLFKKDIQSLTDDEIKNYFRLYNIGAVVAFHAESVQRLHAIPGFIVLDQTVGPVHLMKVNQPFTWFLRGEGNLTASFNRIQVNDVKGDELILKYHWTNGLTGTPTLKISPLKMADDPIPFVKIENPPPAFVLQKVR